MMDLKDFFGFGNINSLGEALNRLTGPAFTIAGLAVLFYFIIGSFKYLLSGGNKDSISQGQQMITHAIIGFILLMLLFLVVMFIPQFLGLDFKVVQ